MKKPTKTTKKHKWWHFIYGKKFKTEVVYKGKNVETHNFWYECKKCGKQIGEKEGSTTISFTYSLDK